MRGGQPVTGVDLDRLAEELDERLEAADAALARLYPGERPGRQPVHTVYVPADRFHAGLVPAYGAAGAARGRRARGPVARLLDGDRDAGATGCATSWPRAGRGPAHRLRGRLRHAVRRGGGRRGPGAARSPCARRSATGRPRPATASGSRASRPPPGDAACAPSASSSPTSPTAARSRRASSSPCPRSPPSTRSRRWSTSPAASSPGWASAAGSLRFEIQVETPQSVLGPDGTALVARMVHASAGRCTGLHYGTYDYSASCGVAAAHQSLEHPVADHAKAVMQVAAAGTGVRLSDGSTNVLPVGHARPGGEPRGTTTCGSSGGRSSVATTRAGTCTPRSCRRGSPRRSRSTATASTAAAARLRNYVDRRDSASSTSRRPRVRWPTSCCAGSTAGPLSSDEVREAGRAGHHAPVGARAPRHDERKAEPMGIVLGPNRYGKAECARRPHRARHPAPRDPRPHRLHVAAGRLRGRARRRRPVAGAAHRHPEEHRVRLRQGARRQLAGGLRARPRRAGCWRRRRPRPAPRSAVDEHAWDRIPVDGAGHDHAFVRRGGEVRTTEVDLTAERGRASSPGSPTWWC